MTEPRRTQETVAHRIRPQSGPQEAFCSTPADIAFYGGSAGGGKSWALAFEAARHTGHKEYAGAIFRRTRPQLVGGGSIWEEMKRIYPILRGVSREGATLDWRFPSGALIECCHLQYEDTVREHQSKQYSFCVAAGTAILMADGSHRPIESVRTGDLVATLEGPRPVTQTHRMGRKAVARVTTRHGSALVSMTHRLLTPSAWACPDELMSTRSHGACSIGAASAALSPEARLPRACSSAGPLRSGGLQPRAPHRTGPAGSFVSAAGARSGYAASAGVRPEAQQPAAWCGQLVLMSPDLRSEAPCHRPQVHAHALGCAERASSAAGLSDDCPLCFRCGGAPPQLESAGARPSSPSPSDAAEPSCRSRADGQDDAHAHTQRGFGTYSHPYTKECRPVFAFAHRGQARMDPAGEAELYDLTVAGASHYVLASSQVLAANCGFDELTHFSEGQFWYMLSRVRSSGSTVPKRVRGTCNPDPESWVRGFIDWWIGKDGLAIPERSGVIRWFARVNDRIIWADTPDGVHAQEPSFVRRKGDAPREVDDVRPEPMSFTFIRARASDNQILLKNDPEYISRLSLLIGAEAKRLRDGNWDAKDSAGDYFDRTWFPVVDETPPGVVRRVRFWDKAATRPSSANPDPDWTRGVLVALMDDKRLVIEDVVSLRDGPAAVDTLMLHTAHADGKSVHVGAWRDPGQAGVVDVEHMRQLLFGFAFDEIRAAKSKVAYASVWSSSARAGKVLVRRGPWLTELLAELQAFPRGGHDDQVDAISGAVQALSVPRFRVGYDAARDHRHPTGQSYDDDSDDNPTPLRRKRGACI